MYRPSSSSWVGSITTLKCPESMLEYEAMCPSTLIMLSARTLNGSAAKAMSKRLLASVSRPTCM